MCLTFDLVLLDSNLKDGAPDEYGAGMVWEEFHMPTNYRR